MAEERQKDYTIFEGDELPSQGKIYPVKVEKHIELRSMTARDEMKRLSPSTTPLKTLADIIEGCCIEKPTIHIYDMALADYEYLLHKLRIVTYGPAYKVTTKCPECGEIIDVDADLNDLELKEFNINEFNEYKEFSLPSSGRRVSIRFLTPRLLDEIESRTKDMQRKFKGQGFDFETLVRLTTCIESVDGEVMGIADLEAFVNNLPAADMIKILNNLDKLNQCFGLDNKLYLTCNKCGYEFVNFFRIGPEFFRPTNL